MVSQHRRLTVPFCVAGMEEGAEAETGTELCFVHGKCKSVSSPGHSCSCLCHSKGASLQLEQRLRREPGKRSLLGGFPRPLLHAHFESAQADC